MQRKSCENRIQRFWPLKTKRAINFVAC